MTYENYFDKNYNPENNNNSKLSKDVKKQIESSLWLSNEFTLKVQNFLTVLKTLSIGGNSKM